MNTFQTRYVLSLLFTQVAWMATAAAFGGNAAIDLNNLRPTPGLHKVVTQDLATVGDHLALTTQVVTHYADQPLVFCVSDGSCPSALIAHRLITDHSVSFSLWRRVEFALSVPLALYQQSGPPPVGARIVTTDALSDPTALAPSLFALGDVRLRTKVVFYSQPLWGIGATASLSLPSGSGNSFMGSALPSLTVRLLSHWHFRRLTAVLNAGWIFAATESVLNVSSGMAFDYGAALQIELFRTGSTPFSVFGEIFGSVLTRLDPSVDLPAEFVMGAKSQFGAWGFAAGFGSGIHSGAGVPNVRGFLGASWTWAPAKPAVRQP